ncbi:MAG: T9SS type A sorting domain-containing protein [Bacteroidales bacterium]
MSGVYTIGDTTGGMYYDFLSFNQALNALNTATVCGDVIFEVASDTYYETLEINEIPGVNASSTVTFTSITGDSTDVILEGAPGSSTSGVLFLNEADFISFSHMTIRVSASASAGRTIYVDGGATHNKILNCIVETQSNTSSAFVALYSSGSDDHYNEFRNNHFKNGYYTIYWRGSGTSTPKKSTIFENNIIEGFYYYGLYLYYNDSIMVKNNKFYNRQNSSTNYTLYSYYTFNGFEIGNNEIIINDPTDGGTKYGMRLYYSNYYPYYDPSDAPGLVYNNMIYINNTGSKYGIYSYYNNDVKFYYNTVHLDGHSGYTVRPIYQSNSTSNTEGESFLNNIFINEIGGQAAYYNTPATIQQCDYNNYYTSGNTLAYWNGDHNTLADLQNASGMDTNSVNLLPQFEALGNLRLADLQLAEKGIAVPEVTRDIDGKLRSTPSTTIGAHERYLVPIDVGVAEILSPKDSIKADQPQAVAALIKNYGTDTIHTFDVKYSINNNGDVTTTYNGMIPPMQTDTVFFADTVITAGHHSICFSTVLSTDTMTFNDQKCGTFYGIPPYDIGIIALNKPDSGVCYTNNEIVVVKLVNYGYQNINMINNPVDIQVSVSGPNPQTFPVTTINTNILPVNGSQNVQVASNYDMSQSGLYTFHASAEVAVDGDTANNAMRPQEIEVNATITSFPFSEDFESFTPGNGSSFTGDFQNGWSSVPNVSTGEFQWYAHTGTTPSSNTGPPGDHTKDDGSGNYMYAESNYGSFQQRAMFISPCLDLGSMNNPVLRFWYFMYGSQVYSLRVDVNDGSGWQNSVGYVIGQQQYSQNAAWEQKVVDLSAFAGDIVRLRFRAIRGPGTYGDIAIDDVMIYEPQPVELAVKAIHAPTVEHGLAGSMEQVEVEIESLGLDTVDIFDIGFYAGDMQPVMETWTGSLNPFQTVSVTFSSPYQIQKGNDPLKVFVTHPADQNKMNDTAYYHLTGFATENIPWFDDFEGPDWWRGTGQTSQWERGTPSAATINTPYSGSNVWAINLDGHYAANASDLLYSPYFDFSSVQGATLELQHWYESEQDHDGGFIQYTQSFGNSWQSLGVMNDPLGTNWYNSSNGAMHIWSGSSGGWIQSSFDLAQFDNATSPVQFRFAYTADVNNSNYDGWAIDNFNIRLPKISQDAGVAQILDPAFYANANGQHVRVNVVNYGTNALTSIPLEYTVNGANTVSETWTGNLQAGDTLEYVFNATLNVPSAAAFELCVTSDVSGDSNTFNDEICKDYAFDAGVKYIMNPLLISFKDDSLYPAVMLHNYGSDTIYSMDVYYRVKNDPPVTETWNGVLAPGENQQYIFNQSFVSPAGLYQICAGTDLAGDTEGNNDESCKYATGKEHDVGIDYISATADFEVGPCRPNPANDYTLIPVDLKQPASLQFRLYDLTGKELIRRNHKLSGGRSDIRLNVNTLAAGMYYYSIASANHTVTGKVVIQR